jgi:hypothetical protein
MFLSMPLTIIVMMLLDSFEETRWVANLMAGSSENPTQVEPEPAE